MDGVLSELLQVVDRVHEHHIVNLQRLRGLGVVLELHRALGLSIPDVIPQDVTISDPDCWGLQYACIRRYIAIFEECRGVHVCASVRLRAWVVLLYLVQDKIFKVKFT